MHRLATVLAAALALTVTFSLVGAPLAAKPSPKAEAKQRYTAGMAAYNLEDYDGAIKEFDAAYRLVQDPLFLFNIGQAHRLAKRPEKALLFYRRYLTNMPGASNRSDVERWMAELEKQLAAAREAKATPPPVEKPPPPAPRPAPPAVPLVERETNTGYLSNLTSDGKLYTLVGLGVRKVMLFKVYGMALYVEDEPARALMVKLAARAGGRDLAHLTVDDLAQSFVLLGDFGKMGLLKFVRDVSAADVQKAYRDSLLDELKSPPPDLKRDIDRFVGLFAKPTKSGDEVVIHSTAEGEIYVEVDGKRLPGPTNHRLAQAIWNIWLGPRPISPDLRKALVGRIDALAK
jgi:tetratricopeptide (TPR) repeat protein